MTNSNKSSLLNSTLDNKTSKPQALGAISVTRETKSGKDVEREVLTRKVRRVGRPLVKTSGVREASPKATSFSLAKERAQQQIKEQQKAKALQNVKIAAQKKAQAEARKRKALGLEADLSSPEAKLLTESKDSTIALQQAQAKERARLRREYTKSVRAKRKVPQINSNREQKIVAQPLQGKTSLAQEQKAATSNKLYTNRTLVRGSSSSSSQEGVNHVTPLESKLSPQPAVHFKPLPSTVINKLLVAQEQSSVPNSLPKVKQRESSKKALVALFNYKEAVEVARQPRVKSALTQSREQRSVASETNNLVSNLLTLSQEESNQEINFSGIRGSHTLNSHDLEAAGELAVASGSYRDFTEQLGFDKEKEAADKLASFENGTVNSDYISPSDLKKKRASTRDDQELDKQKLIQQQRKTVFARLAYLNNEYGIKDYNKPLSLLKVLYKDLSKSLFWTFFLLLSLLFTSLGRIYLSKVVRDDIITYSHYLKDSRVLTSSTKNLTLEKVYLTSQYYLIDNANKLNMHPQEADKEILIVVPKISDAKVLPLTNLNPGLLKYLDLNTVDKKLNKE